MTNLLSSRPRDLPDWRYLKGLYDLHERVGDFFCLFGDDKAIQSVDGALGLSLTSEEAEKSCLDAMGPWWDIHGSALLPRVRGGTLLVSHRRWESCRQQLAERGLRVADLTERLAERPAHHALWSQALEQGRPSEVQLESNEAWREFSGLHEELERRGADDETILALALRYPKQACFYLATLPQGLSGLVERAGPHPAYLVQAVGVVLLSHPRWPAERQAISEILDRFDEQSICWLATHDHPAFDALARRWARRGPDVLERTTQVEWAISQATGDGAAHQAALFAWLDNGIQTGDGQALDSPLREVAECFPDRMGEILTRLARELPREQLIWLQEATEQWDPYRCKALIEGLLKVDSDVSASLEAWLLQHDEPDKLRPESFWDLRELGAVFRRSRVRPMVLRGKTVPTAIIELGLGVDTGGKTFRTAPACVLPIFNLELGGLEWLEPDQHSMGRPLAVIGRDDGGKRLLVVALDSPDPRDPLVGLVVHPRLPVTFYPLHEFLRWLQPSDGARSERAELQADLDDAFARKQGGPMSSVLNRILYRSPELLPEVLTRLAREFPRDQLPDALRGLQGDQGRWDPLPEVVEQALLLLESRDLEPFDHWIRQHDSRDWGRCPLSREIIEPLRELGATYRHPAPPAVLDGEPVPAAIYALVRGVRFGAARFESEPDAWPHVTSLRMNLWSRLEPKEYPLCRIDRPLGVIGHADGGNYLLVLALDSPDPHSPLVGLVDHDDPEQELGLFPLSRLLSTLRVQP